METRQVKVLFSYTEKVIPPRCRNPRDQRFDDGEILVDVRVVSADEAPVALIHSRYDFDDVTLKWKTDYRWFDDRLWVQRRVGSTDDVFGLAPPDLIDARDSGPDKDRVPRWAGRKECKESLEDWLVSFIEIDGRQWKPVDEPRYYVDDSSTWGACLRVEYHFGQHAARERYFSLQQYAQAKACLVALNDSRGRETSDQPLNDRFEVLLPDVLTLNKDGLVDVIVFGLLDTAYANDSARQEQHLLEVSIKVPHDALQSRSHLNMASRKMRECYGNAPQILFDEHSPAGQTIVTMRNQIASLVAEKASRMSQDSSSDSVLALDL